ncbi:hypothetical protein CerSpe_228930 [Prunus speciosa]
MKTFDTLVKCILRRGNCTKLIELLTRWCLMDVLQMREYGSAALSLAVSFLCSSMAIGFLIDANFLINASGDHEFTSSGHIRTIFEKGFILALVSNRMLCITFPMLLWMVWGLYGLDFVGKLSKGNKQSLS